MKYEKMYSKDGLPFYFKIDNCDFKNKRVVLEFIKPREDVPSYHIPNKVFRNVFNLIKYLQKNIETKNIKFDIKISKGI